MSRTAVVLFNLGGPDNLQAVRPFLFNLFRDPAIIGAPAFVRYPLAALISTTREKTAQANYAIMGGRSPLLEETEAQRAALEAELQSRAAGDEIRVFIAMRYWKPFARETARQVEAFAPDDVILLPLYPHYSTTTTGSSLKDWLKVYRGPGRSRAVGCYPTADGLVDSVAASIRKAWVEGGSPSNVRLLFSAHGLPQKIVDAGDPYRVQIEATAAAVAARLPELTDWRVCFQSRVGPLKWLDPSTEDEIRVAGVEGKGVLISPIAFVSEHVETLVELDHEYAELAKTAGVTPYLRARTPGVDPAFIAMLANAAHEAPAGSGVAAHGGWSCPDGYAKCACRAGAPTS